jgi:hypothetical protein
MPLNVIVDMVVNLDGDVRRLFSGNSFTSPSTIMKALFPDGTGWYDDQAVLTRADWHVEAPDWMERGARALDGDAARLGGLVLGERLRFAQQGASDG